MKSSEVRKTFLQYFEKHGHPILPSSPVVPHGDDTLLFTNAGMVQFKDYFTGASAAPETPRATTVQKCIRAGGKHNDLDNVGYTTRHLTFFEMLGNFSFGDYFKKEAIAFAWELVTEGFGIDPSQLWVTVYNDDDEAHQLWQDVAGVSEKRIARLGEKDNFWSMGDVGPCGPCSEILLDRGEKYGEQDFDNGERFFEIWNLVFMQYEQSKGGARAPLPRPSIDTGMGLERLAIIKQGVDTVFETDVLRTIIAHIEELSGVKYDAGKAGVPHRVLADHARSLVFCLADGAEISNLGRGYVVRRILRRAARYGRKIYDKGPILHQLVKTVIDEMGEAYPEIVKNREFITKQVENEENRFGVTLDRGIEIFDGIAKDLKESGDTTVSGEQAFKLHGTYGFPFDLVQRMSDEAGLEVDEEGYRKALKDAQEISRAGGMPSVASSAEGAARLEALPETDFVGYSSVSSGAELQDAYEHDGAWHLVLSQTPFYAESGGQIGDAGIITSDDFRLAVRDTQKSNGRFVHTCDSAISRAVESL
ncbi:MAG: alanine--tRNA ligase [Planctomycetota bacterium]